MRLLRVVRDRLRALVARERVVDDIHDELEHHRVLLVEQLRRDGRSLDDAIAEADRRLGNFAALRDRGYDVRGGGVMETIWQDLRYGVRLLWRSPAFSLTTIAALALGIGANTAIFSVASGVLLRPLPYPNADQLAMIWMDNARINIHEDWHSYVDYTTYGTENRTFASIAVFNSTSRTLTGQGSPERISGAYSTPTLFDVLGVKPAMGRVYADAEDREGGPAVIVLSHRFWQRRMGGRADVLGRKVELNGRAAEVIGVMPEGFAFPTPESEYWVPIAPSEQLRNNAGSLWLQMIGRRKAGTTVAQAQADLERVNNAMIAARPGRRGYGVWVRDYREQIVGNVRPAILVLTGAVAFVLLIACTNVANLLLSRSAVRERELALRAAIGAGRQRLVRQLLTESTVLAAIGGVLGLALAWLGLQALVGAAPPDLPRLDAIGIDAGVLAFTLVLSMVTGLVFGAVPAWQLAWTDPSHALKEGSRGSSALGRSLRRGLVVVEVALAIVLLVGAGLMLRSFARLQHVDLGFRTDHLLSGRVSLWGPRYREAAPRVDFFTRVVSGIEAQPGVEAAAAIGALFLSSTPNSTNFSIEGRPDFRPEESVEVPTDAITPNYFKVMGIPIRRGRTFDDRDNATAETVAIINETMARQFWGDKDPLGQRIKYGQLASQGPWMTIVGVVADTRRTGYDAPVRPEVYQPLSQRPDSSLLVLARTTGDPQQAVGVLRRQVQDVDASIAVHAVATVDEALHDMTAQRRLNTLLLSAFGIVAAMLAAVGIYGVMAHAVAQRTRELGVRVALGASHAGILRLVLVEGLTLAGIGLAVGLTSAFLLSRTMATMLYEVSATDPATFAAIAALAVLTALLATVVPALRAIRVDPVTALRTE